MSWLEVLLVIGVVGYVIYQQVAGQAVQARRLIAVPAIVTIVGFVGLHDAKHIHPADVAWIAAGAIGSLLIGLAFGAVIRLSERDGALWSQLPLRWLWLWLALIAYRALIMLLASKSGAHVAASSTPLLFTLGLNRLGQAAVIAARAMAAGLPFAPDSGGRGRLSGRPDDRRADRRRDRAARY